MRFSPVPRVRDDAADWRSLRPWAQPAHGTVLGGEVGIGIAIEVGVDPDAVTDTDPE